MIVSTSGNANSLAPVTTPDSMETLVRFRRQFYKISMNNVPTFAYRQIANVLVNSLKTELAKPYLRQDQKFIVGLLNDLTTFRHHELQELVAVIANTHVSVSVRECARLIYRDMNQSLFQLYEQTQSDRSLSLRQRSHALYRARTANPALNCMQVVQVIFENCKDCNLGEDDGPLSSELREMLRHPWERVRLAACWVSIKSWANGGPGLLREALLSLTDLAINSFGLSVGNDAVQLLRRVRELSPFAAGLVRAGEADASNRFFKRTAFDCSPVGAPNVSVMAQPQPRPIVIEAAPLPQHITQTLPQAPAHQAANQTFERASQQSTPPLPALVPALAQSSQQQVAPPASVRTFAQTSFFRRYYA